MARVHNNPLLQGVRGKIGDSIVVKQYSYGTVISVVPDMRRVKPSVLQKMEQNRFAKAVAYAQSIVRNREQKAAWAAQLPPGASVYHAALKAYLAEYGKEGVRKGG